MGISRQLITSFYLKCESGTRKQSKAKTICLCNKNTNTYTISTSPVFLHHKIFFHPGIRDGSHKDFISANTD